MSTTRKFCAVGIAALIAAALQAPAAAAPPETEVIVLPGASSAEGIAVGEGSTFYAGDLFAGDIFRGDLRQGTAALFIDAPAGRMAVGMSVDQAHGLLFVAGGFTGQAYVYDTGTGATVASYQLGTPGASLVNDVALTRHGAWFTDTAQPVLYFVPVSPTGTPGPHSVLPLSGPAADTSKQFNNNGIVATPDGATLLVGHSENGVLNTVDPVTGASATVAGVSIPFVDGMILEAGWFWAVQNFQNKITRWRLSPDLTSGTLDKTITDPAFQVPATAAIHGDRLAAVNAKFDTGFPPTADQYEVVVVPR